MQVLIYLRRLKRSLSYGNPGGHCGILMCGSCIERFDRKSIFKVISIGVVNLPKPYPPKSNLIGQCPRITVGTKKLFS